MQLVLDLPESSFSVLRTTPEEFAKALTQAAVCKWYELGKISQAKGAELCGVNRADFLDILSSHRVSIVQYTKNELDAELA